MGISTLLKKYIGFVTSMTCLGGLLLCGGLQSAVGQALPIGPTQPVKISADKAVGGDEESFSGIGSVGVDQTNSTGFPLDAVDKQFYIDVPENWVFDTTSGYVTVSTPVGQPSMFYDVSIAVSPTRATVTYSTTATATIGSKLIVDGLRVKSSEPRNITEEGATLKIGYPLGSAIIGIASGSNIGTLMQTPGLMKSLMVLLPGESYTQSISSSTGKAGTPLAQVAGRPFNVTVIAVDKFFNKVQYELDQYNTQSDLNHTVSLSSTDAGFINSSFDLNKGEGVASVKNSASGTYTITANDVTVPTVAGGISTSYVVTKSEFSKLQVLLPGETYSSGAVEGKTGIPLVQVVGTNFSLRVNALDQYNLIDESVNGSVEITHTGFNGGVPVLVSLTNGTGTVNVNSSSSGDIVFTASYPSNIAIANGSSTVEVNSGSYTKILAFFEGQNHRPGSATGIEGNPIIPDRAELIELTILSVDNQFNSVGNIQNELSFEPDEELVMYEEDSFEYLEGFTVNYVDGQYVLRFYIGEMEPSIRTLTIRDTQNNIFTTIEIPLPSIPTNPSDYFRTTGTGNWTDLGTWESSSDNITWNTATLLPSTAARGITIRTGHTISLNSTVGNISGASGFEFLVEEGAILNMLSNNQISFSKTELRGTIISNGEFVSTNTRIYNTGVFTLNSNNSLTIPSPATWDEGSVCNIVGITSQTGLVSGLSGQNLSTVNFNNPGLTGDVHLGVNNDLTIAVLNVINTGTTGRLILLSGNTGARTSVIDSLNITSGRLSFISSTSSGAVHNVNIRGLNFQNGIIRKDGTATANIIFNTTSPAFTIGSAAVFADEVNISFIAGATINFAQNEFRGSTGTLTIANNSVVRTSHTQGLSTSGASGNVQFTGTRTFPTTVGMKYHFNGDSLQNTGNLVGNTLFTFDLVIDNAIGVEMPAGGGNFFTNNLEIRRGYFNLNGARRIAPTAEPFTGPGELRIQHTQTSDPIPANKSWSGTINLNGVNQSIVGGTYNNLTVSGGVKTLTGDIFVDGNFDASGASSVVTGTRKVTYSGSGNQNVAGIPYYDLDVTGSGIKTITAPATVSNNVNVSTGTLNANGNLTLLATEAKNANIAPITNGGAITGNVKVPVIITGGAIADRGARTLSSPINEGASARNTLSQLKDFIPLMGMDGHVGLDTEPGLRFNSSYISKYVETRDNSVNPFNFINNINEGIQPAEGFQIFYVGNRSNMSGKVRGTVSPETVTVVYDGVINQGTINRAITNSEHTADPHNGRNLVGNPYPATLDAHLFLEANSSNLANTSIYTVRKNKSTATYNYAIGAGANGGSRFVRPGQAFYIIAQNDANLIFQESFKHAGNNYGNVEVMNAKSDRLVLLEGKQGEGKLQTPITTSSTMRKMKLRLSNAEAEEEAFLAFSDNFSDGYDNKDSKYFSSDVRTILSSYTSDGQEVSFNLMKDIQESKEVKVRVNAAVTGPVKLNFEEIDNFEYIDIFIKDKFLGTEVLLDKENPEYNFYLDRGQSSSYGSERISLRFVPNETLAIIDQSFILEKDHHKVTLKFTTTDNIQVEKYIVERSADNSIFEEIGVLLPEGLIFTFNDLKPLNGNNYYRIKTVYANKVDMSIVKNIHYSLGDIKVKLFPNPANEQIFISVNELYGSTLNYVITNATGVRLLKNILNSLEQPIDITSLASGIYFIELTGEKGELIGRLKFVKK